MKNAIKVILVLVSLLILFTSTGYAQSTYELYGEQIRGAGTNTDLNCQGAKLGSVMTIIKVTGDNAGFRITDDKGVVLNKFDTMQEAVGIKLNPGTYYIYPNLKQNQNKATVYMLYK